MSVKSLLRLAAPDREHLPETEVIPMSELLKGIGDDLAESIAASSPYAPPRYRLPEPELPKVSQLSAAALATEYEAASKSIAEMGEQLLKAAKDCEAMVATVHEAVAYCQQTANYYLTESKKVFVRIEETNALAEDIRRTCSDMRRRIGVDIEEKPDTE
jgi:hypothetical protein